MHMTAPPSHPAFSAIDQAVESFLTRPRALSRDTFRPGGRYDVLRERIQSEADTQLAGEVALQAALLYVVAGAAEALVADPNHRDRRAGDGSTTAARWQLQGGSALSSSSQSHDDTLPALLGGHSDLVFLRDDKALALLEVKPKEKLNKVKIVQFEHLVKDRKITFNKRLQARVDWDGTPNDVTFPWSTRPDQGLNLTPGEATDLAQQASRFPLRTAIHSAR